VSPQPVQSVPQTQPTTGSAVTSPTVAKATPFLNSDVKQQLSAADEEPSHGELLGTGHAESPPGRKVGDTFCNRTNYTTHEAAWNAAPCFAALHERMLSAAAPASAHASRTAPSPPPCAQASALSELSMPDPHEVYGEGSASALGGPQGRVSEGQEEEGEEEQGAGISLEDIRMVNAAPGPAQVCV
jgi:hypothetical protein